MQPKEWCKDCKERIECIAEEKGCRAVISVMDMVLGDYIGVYEDTASPEDMRLFIKGCEIICSRFDLNFPDFDTDRMRLKYHD
jgi:hypothetical protein